MLLKSMSLIKLCFFTLLFALISCQESRDSNIGRRYTFVLENSVKQNLPIYYNDIIIYHIARENIFDNYFQLYLPDTSNFINNSQVELRRIDNFGTLGLYINSSDSLVSQNDTIFVKSNLEYDLVRSSVDTAFVNDIINLIQNISKMAKPNFDSVKDDQ